MYKYQKFLVKDSDHFEASQFPRLESSLQQVIAALVLEPFASKAEMLICFVRDHAILTQWTKDQPKLTALIVSKTLPLGDLEDLFESSRNNAPFRNGLETYIRNCFENARVST